MKLTKEETEIFLEILKKKKHFVKRVLNKINARAEAEAEAKAKAEAEAKGEKKD